MEIDEMKARMMQLGMKSMQAGGLTPEEEQELAALRQQMSMQTMTRKG